MCPLSDRARIKLRPSNSGTPSLISCLSKWYKEKHQKFPQKRVLLSLVTYQFSAFSFSPAKEHKNPSTLQDSGDLGEGKGGPTPCPAHLSSTHYLVIRQAVWKEGRHNPSFLTVLSSSGTCRVSIYIYVMDVPEGNTSHSSCSSRIKTKISSTRPAPPQFPDGH